MKHIEHQIHCKPNKYRDLEGDFKFLWDIAKNKHAKKFELVPEYPFATSMGRKWRFDYALPEVKIGIELEGGTWSHGRHVTGKGYEKDCEKYNSATFMGWSVFRFTKLSEEWIMKEKNWVNKIYEFALNRLCYG